MAKFGQRARAQLGSQRSSAHNCAAHNFILGPDKPVCTSSGCTFGPVIAKSQAVRTGSVPFTVEGLAAGTYAYWCTIADHAQLGMIGTLTVMP